MARQFLQFFSASSEQERIAPFKPRYLAAFFRLPDQNLVDLLLWYGMMARHFPNVDKGLILPDRRQDILADQMIVYDYIRILKHCLPFQRHKSDISRTCSYQPYFSLAFPSLF